MTPKQARRKYRKIVVLAWIVKFFALVSFGIGAWGALCACEAWAAYMITCAVSALFFAMYTISDRRFWKKLIAMETECEELEARLAQEESCQK